MVRLLGDRIEVVLFLVLLVLFVEFLFFILVDVGVWFVLYVVIRDRIEIVGRKVFCEDENFMGWVFVYFVVIVGDGDCDGEGDGDGDEVVESE